MCQWKIPYCTHTRVNFIQFIIFNFQMNTQVKDDDRSVMERSGQGHLVNFRLLYLVTQLIGAVLIILVISWILMHLEGFGYDYSMPKIIFNWHPLMMITGMIFLYGDCKSMTSEFFVKIMNCFFLPFQQFWFIADFASVVKEIWKSLMLQYMD